MNAPRPLFSLISLAVPIAATLLWSRAVLPYLLDHPFSQIAVLPLIVLPALGIVAALIGLIRGERFRWLCIVAIIIKLLHPLLSHPLILG